MSLAKQNIKHIICEECGRQEAVRQDNKRYNNFFKCTNFYGTNSKYKAFGVYTICKDCLIKKTLDENNAFNKKQFIDLLHYKLNKPYKKEYIDKILKKSTTTPNSILGDYLKSFSMPKTRDLTWEDSDFDLLNTPEMNGNEIKLGDMSNSNNKYISNNLSSFTVTEDLINKWGEGYSKEEYRLFEKKWNKLIDNYGEKTSIHTENLITYIRFRVKEEIATAQGDIKASKDWGVLAEKASENAKINVKQLSKSDISGGVDLITQLFEAVESEVGIIPLLPNLTEQPYDDADMIIWSIINYGRRLEGKPRVEYKDIWNFYDEMLQEHFEQQGFNEKQIKEFKARRINTFRDLEEVYKEPLYENGE